MHAVTRRGFLAGCTFAAARAQPASPVIDIHQHTPYSGRTPEQLVAHQRRMGISKTVLLPAGRRLGLAAGAGGNDTVIALAEQHPDEYVYFANELPDIPAARAVLERYLDKGAVGIGEQKFPVDCDSKHIDLVAEIAQHYDVPVLLHFQHEAYNFHIERFYKVLERWPRVNFIGHAQTWWGNIDKNHSQPVMYPQGPVTPGGLTDRYLSDYPNMFGDLSAGSGRNSLTRDEDHAREFLARHQNKLLFGSDCSDPDNGGKCIGTATLAVLRRLISDPAALGKILSGNAACLIRGLEA
jgi:predicted TIM-barrel fold metal-dependent hydrolase